MTKEDDAFEYYCFRASAGATMEAAIREIRELTDEALTTGGFVAFIGPDGDGGGAGGAEPPGHRRFRGPTVMPVGNVSPCSCRRCHPTCPGNCDDCLREAYESDPCFRD
jgi:hypothetical protein